MSAMRAEALEAPEAVAAALAQTREIADIAAQIRARAPRFVQLCARGSSAHAGTLLGHLIARRLGLVAAEAMPSLASIYAAPQHLAGSMFIAISQSGASPDLIAAATQARTDGALTLALTNTPNSPLAAACERHLPLAAGPERSVAATKTVLATLALSIALIDAWQATATPGLASLPDRIARACRLDWTPLITRLATCNRLLAIGRGPALGIARESALKLAETCNIAALAYSAAEFAHGPMALLAPDVPLLAFVQHDAARRPTEALLSRLAPRGPILAAGARLPAIQTLPTLSPSHPDTDVIPMLASLYLATESAARARGLDPDHPASLQKITRTT